MTVGWTVYIFAWSIYIFVDDDTGRPRERTNGRVRACVFFHYT